MIAILCPTRGRPDQARRMVESAKKTSYAVSVIFDFSADDPKLPEYAEHFGDDVMVSNSPGGMPTGHRWNMLAEQAMKHPDTKLFMLGADDMTFETPGWDKALIDHYNNLDNKIHCYHLQDSRDTNGTPHPIFTREWIEFWGFMISPVYLHWYGDTWAKEVSKANGVFTHLRDFSLRHEKPSDEGKPDETHSRIRNFGWNERDRFVWERTGHYLELDKKLLGEQLGIL